MKGLEKYSLDELKKLRKIASQYASMGTFRHDLDTIISTRQEIQKKGLNSYFNMDWWIKNHVFYPWEIEILQRNNITNLQELIDCDLDSLEGITESAKEVFDWARKFYDFRSMEKKNRKPRKK